MPSASAKKVLQICRTFPPPGGIASAKSLILLHRKRVQICTLFCCYAYPRKMPPPRKLAVAFQTSMTRCWAAPLADSRAEQVWRALQRTERFYMYSTGAGPPGTVLFSLQDREFASPAEFTEFAARVQAVVEQANQQPCAVELAYYPAGSLAPKFQASSSGSKPSPI